MSLAFYTTQLTRIYAPELAGQVAHRLQDLVDGYRNRLPAAAAASLSERDSILITYPDQLHREGRLHLQTLAEFCEQHLSGVVNGVHILPFHPSSSDDGFSVMDYDHVDPLLGSWQDIERLGHSFRLMFDAVINHTSAQGEWFQAYLSSDPAYCEYYLGVEEDSDLSRVVRPRDLPLWTEFQAASGVRRLWTTFSADQVDLDYHNPEVLLRIIEILLEYIRHGAQFIRLDAIAYLWKEPGSSCFNLPQTHAIVQLLRSVLDEVTPQVRLVTETNVAHADNIAYFGNGRNEAQMVYNFSLPPLVLHTLITGDASRLSTWAAWLELPSGQVTFLNFLASHDGIGLNPVQGILSHAELDALVERTRLHGGLISYKQNSDGTRSPYELNINYFDALSDPSGSEALQIQVDRFMCAQAIMLCLRGVPGIYFHSLFGSRNWIEGVKLENANRSINRQKLGWAELEGELADPASLRAQVFGRFSRLLSQRSSSAAFHPHGRQEILDAGQGVFAVFRASPDGSQQRLCLHNITARTQTVSLPQAVRSLEPYQTYWQVIS